MHANKMLGLFGVVNTFGRVYGTEVNSEKYLIAAYFVRVDGLARSWLVKIGWKTPTQKTRKEPTSKEPISSFTPGSHSLFPHCLRPSIDTELETFV